MNAGIDTLRDSPGQFVVPAHRGGLILTVYGHYGTRHVPAYTGFNGYDLCGRSGTETDSEQVR